MPQLETEKVKSEDIRGHKTPFIFEKVNSFKQILNTGTCTVPVSIQVQVHTVRTGTGTCQLRINPNFQKKYMIVSIVVLCKM